jgi:hypothetical protein
MTQHAHPGAWLVDLPWALPHWRDPPKTWLDAGASFAQEPVHFLMDYLGPRASMLSGDAPDDRLRALGAMLRDLSAISERRLIDLLTEQAADSATRTVFSLNAQLDAADVPATWKDLLRPWLASPALSTDVASLRDRIAPPATVRALAADYGHALEHWPTLWQVARELPWRARIGVP